MLHSSRTYSPYPTSDIDNDNDNGMENGQPIAAIGFQPLPFQNNTQPDSFNFNGLPAASPGQDYTYADGTAVPQLPQQQKGVRLLYPCEKGSNYP